MRQGKKYEGKKFSGIRQNQTLLFNADNEKSNNIIGNIIVSEALSVEETEIRKEHVTKIWEKEDKGKIEEDTLQDRQRR